MEDRMGEREERKAVDKEERGGKEKKETGEKEGLAKKIQERGKKIERGDWKE